MLSGYEKSVLNAILLKCGEKASCILSPLELLSLIPQKNRSGLSHLNDILKCLEYDEYIDVVLSDKRGQSVYCITLLKRGKGYKRERIQSKRYAIYRIILAAVCALITFVIGKILYFVLGYFAIRQ